MNQFRPSHQLIHLEALQGDLDLQGIVHFEIDFWYVLSYIKGIQDVGIIDSAVFSILMFLGQTVQSVI